MMNWLHIGRLEQERQRQVWLWTPTTRFTAFGLQLNVLIVGIMPESSVNHQYLQFPLANFFVAAASSELVSFIMNFWCNLACSWHTCRLQRRWKGLKAKLWLTFMWRSVLKTDEYVYIYHVIIKCAACVYVFDFVDGYRLIKKLC